MKTQFKINNSPAVFENYDNEFVVANLDSGSHYSLFGACSQLWNLFSLITRLRKFPHILLQH
jgi:hypothetical protein